MTSLGVIWPTYFRISGPKGSKLTIKGKTHGLTQRQFNKTIMEIWIQVIILLIINMQTKLYTIPFSHWFTASPQAEEIWTQKSQIFWISPYSQKRSNSWTRKNLNSWIREREKRIPIRQPTSLYKLSTPPMVWSISISQLRLAVWLCSLPAPALLFSWTWETGKKSLISYQQLKTSVLLTFFLY